jgi:hypothetical protein
MSKGKGSKGSKGRRVARMKRAEVAALDLFGALVDRAGLEAERVLVEVHTSGGRDKRRIYGRAARRTVEAREGGRCWYCGCDVSGSEGRVDHVIPWARGGRTTLANAAWACEPCNASKGARVW